MKNPAIIFLKAIVILGGLTTAIALIYLPQIEGRAANLDLLSIYADPFILYIYVASIVFFMALYQAFLLLGYLGQNKTFSTAAVSSIRSIKHFALALVVLIILAGVFIILFHHQDDDPAGFLALCIAATFIAIIVAAGSSILEQVFNKGLKIENTYEDLLK